MKTQLSLKLLLHAVTAFMALALIAVFVSVAFQNLERRQASERILNVVSISRDVFATMQFTRVERGTVNTGLETAGPIDRETSTEIASLRARSNAALDAALAKVAAVGIPDSDPALAQIRSARAGLDRLRTAVDAALALPKPERPIGLGEQWVAGVNRLVTELDLFSEHQSSEIDAAGSLITEMMKIKQLAWVARDAAGYDRLLVGAAIANGRALSPAQSQQLAMLSGRSEAAWQVISTDARTLALPPALKTSIAQAQHRYFEELRSKRQAFLDRLAAGEPASISGVEWINLSNPPLDALSAVASTALEMSAKEAGSRAAAATRALAGASFLAVLFFACGAFATVFVSRQIALPMAKITATMRAVAQGDLDAEIPYTERGDEIGELGRALAVFRDKGRENRQLASALVRRERLSALGQLTATVAHELRNPLSAIRNTVYSLKELVAGQALDLSRPLDRMERSIARCDRIISDLLDYTRLRELNRSDIVIDSWLEDVLNDQQLPKGVTLVRNLAAPGHVLSIDQERMRQVVINLIDNAAQAMTAPDNTADIRRIVISTAARFEAYELVIADNGPGIPEDILPKIFEPLFSTKSFGTGLGLPVVRQIVEQHGGTIVITSAAGKGTKATLQLPYRNAAVIAA